VLRRVAEKTLVETRETESRETEKRDILSVVRITPSMSLSLVSKYVSLSCLDKRDTDKRERHTESHQVCLSLLSRQERHKRERHKRERHNHTKYVSLFCLSCLDSLSLV